MSLSHGFPLGGPACFASQVVQNMVFGNLLSMKGFYNFLWGVTLNKGNRASFPLGKKGLEQGRPLDMGVF